MARAVARVQQKDAEIQQRGVQLQQRGERIQQLESELEQSRAQLQEKDTHLNGVQQRLQVGFIHGNHCSHTHTQTLTEAAQ